MVGPRRAIAGSVRSATTDGNSGQWYLALGLFALIVLVLVIAALVIDPLSASVP